MRINGINLNINDIDQIDSYSPDVAPVCLSIGNVFMYMTVEQAQKVSDSLQQTIQDITLQKEMGA